MYNFLSERPWKFQAETLTSSVQALFVALQYEIEVIQNHESLEEQM